MNDKLNNIKEQLLIHTDNAWRNFKRFVRPAHPRFRKAYPRHEWCDLTEAIVRVNFAMILDFWYEEVCKDIVDWDHTSDHKEFYEWIKKAVYWIEFEKPELERKANLELEKASKMSCEVSYEKRYGEHDKIIELIESTDDKVLKEMIDKRQYFWT